MLDGIGSICMSEVISANKEAVVKSCLASWKRQQSERNTRVASSTAPSTPYFLYFSVSLVLSLSCFSPPLKCNFFPFTLPYISFVLALFWFMVRHRGSALMNVWAEISHSISVMWGQCEAGIDWPFSWSKCWWIVCRGVCACGLVLCRYEKIL